MYKTAVYRLVNGRITHQKQQLSEKVILRGSMLTDNVLLRSVTFFKYLLFFMCYYYYYYYHYYYYYYYYYHHFLPTSAKPVGLGN